MAVEARAEYPPYALETTPRMSSRNSSNPKSLDQIIGSLNLNHHHQNLVEKGISRKILPQELLNNKAGLLDLCKTTEVAAHEIGHAHVVRFLGGEVNEISVIPSGNVLGYTKFRFYNSNNYDFITNLIASAYGSKLAEQKFGIHDHSGCGGDNAQIEYYAQLGEKISQGRWNSNHLKSVGKQKASLAIASLNSADHLERSFSLAQKKVA